MARNPKFPTFKNLILSCGCTIGVGSNVDPASVEKCAHHRMKVTAILAPAPLVETTAPVTVPDVGAQMRLDL